MVNSTYMNTAITTALAPCVLTTTLGSYSTTAQMNTQINLSLTYYVTNTALTNTLSGYTVTTGLTTLLAAKQDTISAGSGTSISGPPFPPPTHL